jgi:pyruvate kinase
MEKKILCTLGPSSLDKKVIERFTALGVNLLRINLSHTDITNLPNQINFIRKYTSVPICIDTEGAQVRINLNDLNEFYAHENQVFKVYKNNASEIQLNPGLIFSQLKVGDLLTIGFDSVLGRVVEKGEESLSIRVIEAGTIGNNKAVTVLKKVQIPPFSEKDLEAFKICQEFKIKDIALSFTNFASDITELRSKFSYPINIISKIECENAVKNLDEIVQKSEAILIDRGDLSREYSLERIPSLQERIIKTANKFNTDAFVATNLLESMIEDKSPTRAEVNDVFTTLSQGARGLVLAAETAIGKYPVKSVRMIKTLINEYNDPSLNQDTDFFETKMSFLNPPHGGKLVQGEYLEISDEELSTLPSIVVDENTLTDCDQITSGVYSPLKGFLDKEQLESVLFESKVEGNIAWTLPILLQIKSLNPEFKNEDRIALKDVNGNAYYIIKAPKIFKYDLEKLCKNWFNTNSYDHPGVAKCMSSGEYFIGGEVAKLKDRPRRFESEIYSPKELRYIFNCKGWSKIVGFHSRNVIHRCHEAIQKHSLNLTDADALLLSPVIGEKKKNDFNSDVILRSYQLMIDKNYYPQNRVFLAPFSTYSRYSGPREAVFTMLCRKNLGCSHFILGRDHTGVGNFYDKYASQRYIDSFDNLGIEPVFVDEFAYNFDEKDYTPVTPNQKFGRISGTELRESLLRNEDLPSWFVRDEILRFLQDELKAGKDIFVQ